MEGFSVFKGCFILERVGVTDSRGRGVLLRFSQTQSFGVVFALIVRLGHSGGAEGSVTQLAVVVFRGQYDSASALRKWLQTGQ